MSKSKYIIRPTAQEDKVITKAALTDPDALPLTEDDFQNMPLIKSRGRPIGSGKKTQITVRLDDDVIEAFRSDGAGWQTRMNDVLKEWVLSHNR